MAKRGRKAKIAKIVTKEARQSQKENKKVIEKGLNILTKEGIQTEEGKLS